MHELIGKAKEEDEQFWELLGFQEVESDEDYEESSAEEDEVDSDFDKPEDENEVEIETESTKERGSKKKAPTIPKLKTHHHTTKPSVVPSQSVQANANASAEKQEQPNEEETPLKKTKRLAAETSLPPEQRSVAVREKTLERTKEAQRRFAEWEKKQIEKEQKRENEPKPLIPEKLTQIDQLRLAAITEQENIESLRHLQQIELTKQKQGYKRIEPPAGTTIRSTQKIFNGHPRVEIITPTTEQLYTGSIRPIDSTRKLLSKKALLCAISGKKAKYLDPMTKMTYATKEAFKILREKFYQLEEEKLNQRIQALNELLSLKKDKHKRHKILKPGEENVVAENTQNVKIIGVNKEAEQNIPAQPIISSSK